MRVMGRPLPRVRNATLAVTLVAVGTLSACNQGVSAQLSDDTLFNASNGLCELHATPLRRLNPTEYHNTLEDLFPTISIPNVNIPGDNRRHEFDNDAAVMDTSIQHIERYNDMARGITENLGAAIMDLVPCTPADPSEEAACGEQFVRQQGSLLFRRPLTDEQVTTYSAFFTAAIAGATFQDRVQLTLEYLLTAPEFLYRFEHAIESVGPGESALLDAHSLATRISYFITASAPDAELRAAADDGSLMQPEVLEAHVDRLLTLDRSRDAFLRFHEQWLDLDRIDDVTKRTEDNFTTSVRDSMREQSLRFVESVLYNDGGSFADLLVSPRIPINADLAPLYGVPAPATEWEEITDPNRVGFLTQPSFLASHGHPDKPSPVLRGTFILDRVMCTELGAPPPNAEAQGNAQADELEGPLTNREVYTLITSDGGCSSCHDSINPAGFAFEAFDTMGRHRLVEETSGLQVDTTGAVGEFDFVDANDFSQQLAASDNVQACMVQKWVRYAFAGSETEDAGCFLTELREGMDAGGGSVRSLQRSIATHPWFHTLVVGADG